MEALAYGKAATRIMQLRALCGRPLLLGSGGWLIAGWITDVLLDPAAKRVAAFEVRESDRREILCVAPFAVKKSAHLPTGLDTDPDTWTYLDRAPGWTSTHAIDEVTVVSRDGEWLPGLTDAQCDPLTWRLVAYRLRRPWWSVFGKRTLPAQVVVASSADVMIVDECAAGRA